MTDTARDLIQRLIDALTNAIRVIHNEDGTQHISTAAPVLDEALDYLSQPEPEGPTDEEIMNLMPQLMHEDLASAARAMAAQAGTDNRNVAGMMRIILNRHAVDLARAVLARWGRPAIEPVPVDEHLPEAEDCDGENQCWQWDPKSDAWVLYTSVGLRLRADVAPYWLPHHALPVPQDS